MAAVGPVIARMRARASRETAWTYFADPALRRTWWPDAELDVRFGGAVSERWSDGDGPDAANRDAVGTIDVLIAGHALGFRWRDGADEHETAVLITLRSHDTETDIMVTETGFGRFTDAFERTADAQQSWIELLTELTAALRGVEDAGGAWGVGAEPGDAGGSGGSGGSGDAGEAALAEPVDAAPEEAAPEEAAPEEAEPEPEEGEGAEAGEAEPEETLPEETVPEETVPEEAEAPSEVADPDGGSPDETDRDGAESAEGAEAGVPDFDSILRGDSAER